MTVTIEEFLARWEEPFRKVHEALNLFAETSEKEVMVFHPGPAITFEERIDRQKIWLYRLEHVRKEDELFLQPYWVPVQPEITVWYVDLSKPDLPVFSIFEVFHSPDHWNKIVIWDKLSDLLLETVNNKDWKRLIIAITLNEMKVISEGYDKRNQMMWDGKIPLPAVYLEEVFMKNEKSLPVEMSEIESFTLSDVFPMSVFLFGLDTKITVASIKKRNAKPFDLLELFNREPVEKVPEEEAEELLEDVEEEEEEEEEEVIEYVECDHDEFKDVETIRKLIVFTFRISYREFMQFQFDLVDYDATVWLNEKRELLVIGHDKEKLATILSKVREAMDQLKQ